MARILFSAAGGPVISSIIKSLQSKGHSVIGMDAGTHAVGQYFCDKYHTCPMATDEKAYINFLHSIIDEFDLFFPFIDEELQTLARNRDLSDDIWKKLFLSDPKTLLLCTDKNSFQDLAEDKKIPIAPRTNTVPAFAKPSLGRGSRGLYDIEDEELLSYVLKKDNYLLQKKIKGIEYTVDVLVDGESSWVFGVARKRLQANGVSIIGEIDMADDILDLARSCVEKISFRGPINIQIIREQETGSLYLIEINSRLSGSNEFSRLAGFDIIQSAIDLFEGKEFTKPSIKNGMVINRYWTEIADNS